MKKIKIFSILSAVILSLLVSSCRNQDVEFPDFDYSTVYFAYQYPVRTIVLGEDVYDTSLDNQHKFQIYATMGGVYTNKKRVAIDFVVDNSLTDNLFYADSSQVMAMPSSYYALAGNQIILDKSHQGAVDVQLSDAFFADKNSLKNTYVVPLRMTNVTNADSILSGTPAVDNPVRTNTNDWNINLPKDYVLYCVKFINKWHGNFLRRGVDKITEDGSTSTVIRHKPSVENDEITKLQTLSLTQLEFPMDFKDNRGSMLDVRLTLDFDPNQAVTIRESEKTVVVNDTVTLKNITATGTGKYIDKGEKNSWGNKDRDVLHLDYNVSYDVEVFFKESTGLTVIESKQYATKDTLVARDRGVAIETFSPLYIK